jgi:hypothetical protein
MDKETITPEKGTVDLQVLINNLDQRGLLVLLVLLGQRAIQVLESEKEEKVKPPFKTSLYIPG